jgi:periplasmic protein TonB
MPKAGSVSSVLHLILLAFLLIRFGKHTAPFKSKVTHGKKTAIVYLPSRALPKLEEAKFVFPQKKKDKKKIEKKEEKPKPVEEALGDGDVTVALATFYPPPKPDLTTLPHGTRGDVVIDVVIDETGAVVDTKVEFSLGEQVDAQVMETVETWTFVPAMKDGKPVSSAQQLLFHYERA